MIPLIKWVEKEGQYLSHICPGCNEEHLIPMWGDKPWSFNQNLEKPSLSPSVKHTFHRGKQGDALKICHYFIRDGKIEYCSDCWHPLSGQTVDLPPVKI